MDLGLKDKIVIVTGSNGAIGADICKGFLKEGAHVVPFYRDDIRKLEELLSLNLKSWYE